MFRAARNDAVDHREFGVVGKGRDGRRKALFGAAHFEHFALLGDVAVKVKPQLFEATHFAGHGRDELAFLGIDELACLGRAQDPVARFDVFDLQTRQKRGERFAFAHEDFMRDRVAHGFDGRHLAAQIGQAHVFNRERAHRLGRERFVGNRVVEGRRGCNRQQAENAQRRRVGSGEAAAADMGEAPRAHQVDDAFAEAAEFFTDDKLRSHAEKCNTLKGRAKL